MELLAPLLEQFSAAFAAYFQKLDWFYIITLILISEIINRVFPDKLYSVFGLRLRFPIRYRVPFLGLVLAVFIFFLNDGQTKYEVRVMLQSMVAAMVLHLWFLEQLIRKYLPKKPK